MALVATIQLLLGVLVAAIPTNVHSIGVCYGRNGNNLPVPSEVVKMYKSHGISAMRLYSPDEDVLKALRGSGIPLMVGVPNKDLQSLAANPSAAAAWVKKFVKPYHPDVSFRYIAVGNEVIGSGDADVKKNERSVLPAMKNLYAALAAAGLQNKIKVSTAVFQGVLADSYPPSKTKFSPEAAPYMIPIVQFLASHGAPLLANAYTYFPYIYSNGQININYALFNPKSPNVPDGKYTYYNLFDAVVDSFYAAMEKVEGGASVAVVVSESGWPSAGNKAATLDNARTYVQNLVRHVSKGTPKKPGRKVETYIFAMFNENQKPGDETEKHFGLFNPNKTPVYPIDFSGN